MLNSEPDARPHHCQHQSERASSRPKQEQAEHGKYSRDCVENDHHLAMRKTHLEQLMVDVLPIGGKNGAAADKASDN